MGEDKLEAFKKKIIGKKIVDIIVEPYWEPYYDEKNIECDAGDIYLVLDDGTKLRIWNSEWGGIEIQTPQEEKLLMRESK